MKKNVKDYIEANAPKTNKKYEDYLAVKEKEQQELQEMADLMEQPEIPMKGRFGLDYGDDDSYETFPELDAPNVLSKAKVAATFEQLADGPGPDDLQGVKTYVGGQPVGEAPLPPSVAKKLIANDWPPSVNTTVGAMERGTFQPSRKLRTSSPPRRSTAQFMNPSIKVEDEFVGLMAEVNSDNAKLPADKEMLDKVRDGFKITRTSERTLIYVVVRSKDFSKNVPGQIRCCGGIAFGGYARDQANDTFLVECVDHIHMGTVPFGLKLSMPNCGSWSVEIPIPEKVLEKTFTPKQRKALADLKEKYSEEEYEVFYLQLLVAN